jgi:hypothetical protein
MIANATWRNEMVRQEDEDALPTMVLLPRVQIVPTEELDKATLDAIAEVSQNANGSLRNIFGRDIIGRKLHKK